MVRPLPPLHHTYERQTYKKVSQSGMVSICNSALIKLGQERISSLSENNKRAILCSEQYDKIRRKTLSEHLWNFSLKRVDLGKTGNKLAYGPANEFQLPEDVLSVLMVNNNDSIRWNIEDNKLYTDYDRISIWYISDIQDTSKFRPYFSELLAWELAYDICYALIESSSFKQVLKEDLIEARRNAYFLDAREGTPVDFPIDTFTSSRIYPDLSKTQKGWY